MRVYKNTKLVMLEKKMMKQIRSKDIDIPQQGGGGKGKGGGERRQWDQGRYSIITDSGHIMRCNHVLHWQL